MKVRRVVLLPFVCALALIAAACTPPADSGGGATNDPPTAHAGATPTTGQAPLLVHFSPAGSVDPDGFIEEYKWNFGDGSPISNLPDPLHTYSAGGVYTATLTITDDGGKIGTAAVQVVVSPPDNLPPVAGINADTLSGKTPLTVNFESNSSDPDGTIVGYEWKFGDGSQATTEDASHTYLTPGNFVVTLKVTDNNGAVNTDVTTIVVSDNDAPTASAVATPTSGKAPFSSSFDASASSDPDGNIVSWDWDFDDAGATGTGEIAVHTFNTVGTYDVVLTVTDNEGLTDTTTVTVVVNPPQAPSPVANATPDGTKAPLGVVFSSAGSTDTDGSIIGYSWNFGDGSPADTSANPSHLYTSAGTFNAVLTVTDDDFLTATATVPVIVGPPNVPPVASGTATPSVGKPVLNVTFSSAASTDSDGTIVSRSWNFGDGSPISTSPNPSHSYSTIANYSVLLTVTDNDGAINTTAIPVSVIPNSPPSAQPVATPRVGKEPLSVVLTGGTSSDSDGTIVSYAWDWTNDGSIDSTDVDTSFEYVTPGTYEAALTVTDEDGAVDTQVVEITVNPNQAPTAVANADFQSGNAPLSVVFEGRDSLDAELEGTITYDWDFDDGSPHSSSPNPTHVFQDIRDYTVTLTVTDDNGATDTDTIVIHALDPVVRVSAAGNDTTGDGTVGAPYATIQGAITGAVAQQKTRVAVAGGSYTGFTAASGVSVVGGYDQSFVKGGSDGATAVTVTAGAGATAATVSNLALPITLKDLTLVGGGGPNATGVLVIGSTVAFEGVTVDSGTASGAGSSAYGIRAIDGSTVTVTGSSIQARNGVAGAVGADGTAGGAGTNGANGATGNNAGGAAANPGSPLIRSGGGGGNGVVCAGLLGLFCLSAVGGAGGSAGGDITASPNRGGAGGAGGATNSGGGGGGGAGVIAPTVAAAANGVAAPGDTYSAGTGGTGGAAAAAGGGGGGGGGASNNTSGSGGGGAGGMGGLSGLGGLGGTGGGGSFAIYATDSSLTVTSSSLDTGNGGQGGKGGTGGVGGKGGNGGTGGTGASSRGAGGGGGGGAGGNGGGGGAGGNGGPSIGAYHAGTGTLSVDAPTEAAAGLLGTAGAGGLVGAGGAGGALGSAGAAGPTNGGGAATAGAAATAGSTGPAGTVGTTGMRRVSFDNGVVANTPPIAVSNATPTTGVALETVTFSSAGSYDPDGTITYSWNFGDGSPASTSANPTHTYDAGSFTATLTVTDNDGATATSTQAISIAVNQAPTAVANGVADKDDLKAPLKLDFSSLGSADGDGSIVAYSWNFGDGSPVSTEENPSHTYTAQGTYDVVLTVTDNKGATGTAPITVVVNPNNVAPDVAITATPTFGKAPVSVAFTSTVSDSDGTIASAVWDFGDGSPTSTDPNPTHVYTAGVYHPTLTVTDDDGATTMRTIEVRSLPNLPPTAAASASPSTHRAPATVTLSSAGSIDFDGSIASYSWNFGDGSPTSSSPNPSHVYAAGTWTATLTVTDNEGATGTATTVIQSTVNQAPTAVANGTPASTDLKAPLDVQFSSAGSVDNDCAYIGPCPGLTYSWNFGDGSPVSTSPDPLHTYTTNGLYTAVLTVTDNEGATDVKSVSVNVALPNVAPEVHIQASTTDGRAPLAVTLTSVGTVDNDGTIATYLWDFGDSSPTENADTAVHTYAAGTFTATLTVTDDNGASTTVPVTIHSTVNQLPVAVASATPTLGLASPTLHVALSSAGSADPDCSYLGGTCPGLTYLWDFGDNSGTSADANPTHDYAPGQYTATLTVVDAEGGISNVASVAIDANTAPTAVATADHTSGDGPLTVNFAGSASTDNDGSVVSYLWDFGDGTGTTTVADPSHTYAPGLYTATLTVTDNDGQTSTAQVSIDVNDKPTASSSANVTSGTAPLTVNFTGDAADSDGSFSFAWDFGDGSPPVTDDLAPSHTFTGAQTYTVTFTVTDDRGSVVSATPLSITAS